MHKHKPFVINHTMTFSENDIKDFSSFWLNVSENTGNSYITHSLMKELYNWECDFRGIPNIWEYDFSSANQEADIEYINNEASEVFLMLQDHIRPESINWNLPYNKLSKFISRINKPVYLIGAGCNSFSEYSSDLYKQIPKDLVSLLRTVSEKTNLIGVRGEYTFDVLNRLGIHNVAVIGCPTFYETGSTHRVTVQKDITIEDVVFTNPYNLDVFANQPIILQGEAEVINAIMSTPKELFRYGCYNSFVNAYENKQYRVFSSIKEWKNFISKYKFAVGSRVHGGVLAINCGVPAAVLNSDLRSKEMCEVLKIPHLPHLKNQVPLKIFEHVDFSEYNNSYSKLYEEYVSFLNKNNLTMNKNISEESYAVQPTIKLYNNPEQYVEFSKKYKNEDNKLEIIIILNNDNRKFIEKILNSLYSPTSPIKDNYDITIIDDAIQNEMSNIIDIYCKIHPRLKYVRNNQNIDINKTMSATKQLATKEYVWFLSGNNSYNWQMWYKVVEAMYEGYDAIIVDKKCNASNTTNNEHIKDLPLISTAIYKTDFMANNIVNNSVVRISNDNAKIFVHGVFEEIQDNK